MRSGSLACALGLGAVLSAFGQAALAQEAGQAMEPVSTAQVAAATGAGTPETFSPEVPAEVLSPEAAAFKAALARETAGLGDPERDAIAAFYANRDYQPFWTAQAGVSLDLLRDTVGAADAQGLPVSRYDIASLAAPDGLPEGVASVPLEAAAMRVYLRFGGDLSAGIVRPLDVDPEINIKPRRASADDLLGRLSLEPVDQVLAGLEPQSPDYRALMAERDRLLSVAESGGWGAPVPAGPTLHVGESSPRVAVLRTRLAELGYAPADPAATDGVEMTPAFDATTFDAGLEAQLKAFQREQGLNDDGAAGPRTLAALNASVEARLEQVIVNLERMRWLNRDLGTRRIEVNIPDYSVEMFDGDEVVWESRTVVGEARETRTPEFSDEMTHMVVNPTWHIPDSIATRIYLPKLRNDPSVLERNGMRLFTRSGTEINPRLVNFSQYTAESFPFRVKQNPSSANALGRVKFMFPNQFSIYLHDTPAREYFARDARALSNGCIRLEEPLQLAYVLLEGQVSDPRASFQSWLDAGTERYVYLDRPVQVHLTYRTAFARPDGSIRYREDIYGRDAEVFEALEAKGVRLPDTTQG